MMIYNINQKKLKTKITNHLFNKICLKPKDVKVSSFRIIRRSILDRMIVDKTYFVYLSAITLKITKNIGNIYTNHDVRKYGTSNYNFFKLLKLFSRLYIYYSNGFFGKIFIKTGEQYKIKNKMI